MRFGARLLAIVAAHAQCFVDQQHVGRFAEPLPDQELDEAALRRAELHPALLHQAMLEPVFDLAAQLRRVLEQRAESGACRS